MRIRISNEHLPGYTSEREPGQGRDVTPDIFDIFDPSGQYIGQVVYASRQVVNGTEYGWRPVKSPRSGLSSKVDAVKRLHLYGLTLCRQQRQCFARVHDIGCPMRPL